MEQYNIAFVVEQALGHITHGQNLREVVEKDEEVTGHWILPDDEGNGPLSSLPFIPENWTAKVGQQTRKGLKELEKQVKPDAIFFHTQVTAMLAPDWAGKYPSVISLDATPLQYDRFGEYYNHDVGPAFVEKLKWRLHKYVLNKANRLVTWSQWTKDSLVNEYGIKPEDITVIPPSVDIEWWKRPKSLDPRVNQQRPLQVLFVGGDFFRKGGDTLLSAVRKLRADSVPVELHLVTRSPISEEPGVTVYREMQPNTEALRNLFHESDVFCLPTQGEGLPMVLLEAGASGLPLVSTQVGAISEVVRMGETGLTVPTNDVDSLFAALRLLATDPGMRYKMGQGAARVIAQNHNAEKNGQELLALLKEVARCDRAQTKLQSQSKKAQIPALLTVSGEIPDDIIDQVDERIRPLPDYIAMAADFPADLIDYKMAKSAGGLFGRFLGLVAGKKMMLAWACFRLRNYKVIFTDGEGVGLPLAFLHKYVEPILYRGQPRQRHLMISHWLSVPKKKILFDYLHLQSHIDTFIVYSTWQKKFIERNWGVPEERVVFTPFMVDAHFFSPANIDRTTPVPRTIPKKPRPLVCAVGLELRDYPTLVEAVRGLDLDLVIAADSPWSKRKGAASFGPVPANVHVSRFSLDDLRRLYDLSNFVVVPLYNVNFQAGITAILEAMAMEKAVICSRTIGQTDVIIDGKSGLYVEPENPAALREAIICLVEHPERARELGRAARQQIKDSINLPLYSQRLARQVEALL